MLQAASRARLRKRGKRLRRRERTGLPMVYAVFACHDPPPPGVAEVEAALLEAHRLARAQPEQLAYEASDRYGYPAGFLARYFEKLRFFIHNAVEHVEFNLFTLKEDSFALLWLCLQKDNLLGAIPLKVKKESLLEEERVTKRLYTDYSAFKQEIWQNMVAQNPNHDELMLYKKNF